MCTTHFVYSREMSKYSSNEQILEKNGIQNDGIQIIGDSGWKKNGKMGYIMSR